MSINHNRKEARIFRIISKIIANVKNANISEVTVTGVKLSNDNSHLKVFITFLNSEKKSFQFLNKIKGFVRSQLAGSIGGKFVPSITFVLDNVTKKGNKIDAILKSLKEKDSL